MVLYSVATNNFTLFTQEKVWRNAKKSFFFSKLQQVLHNYKVIFFHFGQILFNLARTLAVSSSREKLRSCFFKVCIDHLSNNLESGKKKLLFWEKSLEKVFNFGFKNLHKPCLQFLRVGDCRLKQVLKPLKLT